MQSGLCISRAWKGLTSSFFLGRRFNKLVVFNCVCKRIGFAVSKKIFSHSVQSAIMHSQSFRGYHNASLLQSRQVCLSVAPFLGAPRRLSGTMLPFLLSPQFSLSDAPFLGAQGGDQSPFLPVGVCPDWGLAPEPYLILWPFLVSWSIPPMSPVGAQPSGDLEHQSEREPGIPSGSIPPHSSPGSLPPAWPSHQSSGPRGQCGWNLTGASRNVAVTSTQETKHHTWRVGELRFIMLGGPEELTLQALSPEQRGYRDFYTQTGMIKWVYGFAGARVIAKSKTKVSEISSSS